MSRVKHNSTCIRRPLERLYICHFPDHRDEGQRMKHVVLKKLVIIRLSKIIRVSTDPLQCVETESDRPFSRDLQNTVPRTRTVFLMATSP